MVGTRSFPFGVRPIFKGLLLLLSGSVMSTEIAQDYLMFFWASKTYLQNGMVLCCIFCVAFFTYIQIWGFRNPKHVFFRFPSITNLWNPVVFSWSPGGPPTWNSPCLPSIVRFRRDLFISVREIISWGVTYDEQPHGNFGWFCPLNTVRKLIQGYFHNT